MCLTVQPCFCSKLMEGQRLQLWPSKDIDCDVGEPLITEIPGKKQLRVGSE